jgi:hypothetical protein
MIGRDLLLKETIGGKTSFRCCRVWDAERFIAEQTLYAKVQDPNATVVVITREEFKNAH